MPLVPCGSVGFVCSSSCKYCTGDRQERHTCKHHLIDYAPDVRATSVMNFLKIDDSSRIFPYNILSSSLDDFLDFLCIIESSISGVDFEHHRALQGGMRRARYPIRCHGVLLRAHYVKGLSLSSPSCPARCLDCARQTS